MCCSSKQKLSCGWQLAARVTCRALWGQAAEADSSLAEMMQVDRDQLQSHPRVFLCPQHSPAAVGSAAHVWCPAWQGRQWHREGTELNQAANEPGKEKEVWEGVGRLDGEDGVNREFSLCLGLSFTLARWLKAWRWVGGKPHHGKLCRVWSELLIFLGFSFHEELHKLAQLLLCLYSVLKLIQVL